MIYLLCAIEMEDKKVNKESSESNIQSGAKDLFDQWRDNSRIEQGDSGKTIAKKLGIRVFGILLMLLFSPILLIIFLFVVAVSL